jgi:MFS family permease
VNISFPVTVVTAPILGAVMGGFLTNRCIGSYEDKRAMRMCLLVYLAYTLISIPGPLTSNIVIWFGIVWVALFLQGFVQPVLMGIILTSVSQIQRPTASSLANFLMTGLGTMIGPVIYGLLQDAYPDSPRVAMAFVFWSPVFGLLCLALGALFQKQSYKRDV